MIEEEMKVGPKGQVVIPRTMRKALKIHHGSKVVFKLADGRLIVENPFFDSVGVFENVARKGSSVSKVEPHAYEEELEARNL
ncbi:AbrB/MazE/SpoVT family DNA-binding domain-containing protein [Candidatus Bathyarchaeota archaeon]|nr:AbrB/MazE/SpoVT family DNA-binding domain-containing protein [Candidatus Bathyarchaeota archaeon]